MKNLNVMQIAWKIYKLTPLTTKFRYALIYAWKLARRGAVIIHNGVLKLKSNIDITMGYLRKTRKEIEIQFDSYNMNLFLYQLIHL